MSVKDVLFSALIRFSFRFERFFPYILRAFIIRKLGEYQRNGMLADYTVRAARRGRHHFAVQIDLYLEEKNVWEVIAKYERKS